MSLVMQERDYRLLTYLYEQGVATSDQLIELGQFKRKMIFYRRIGMLIKASLIQKREFKASNQVGPRHIYMLSDELLNRHSNAKQLSDEQMWKHQLLLNQLRTGLDETLKGNVTFVERHIIFDKKTRGESLHAPIPDLVLKWNDKLIAIELERTIKRDKGRYYSRWNAYTDSTYSCALYFCDDDLNMEYLSGLAANYPKIAFSLVKNSGFVRTFKHGTESIFTFLERKEEVDKPFWSAK